MSKDTKSFIGVQQVIKLVEQRVQLEAALSDLRRHADVLNEPMKDPKHIADIAGMHSVIFQASHTLNVHWHGHYDGGTLQRMLTNTAISYFENRLQDTDRVLALADNKLRMVLGVDVEAVAKEENVAVEAVVESCKDEPAPEVREEDAVSESHIRKPPRRIRRD